MTLKKQIRQQSEHLAVKYKKNTIGTTDIQKVKRQ